MSSFVQYILPKATFIADILLPFLVLALIYRRSWGSPIIQFVGRHAIALAFLTALAGISGSLFYSEIKGYEPCVLCWWQRIFIYPLVVVFAVALVRKLSSPFSYAVPLAILNVVVSGYHSFVYMGGKSLLPCTALGGACSKVYVLEFGYISIPMMSFTIALYILLWAWAHKLYQNENSHT